MVRTLCLSLFLALALAACAVAPEPQPHPEPPVSILLVEIDAFKLSTSTVETLRYSSHGYTTDRTDTPADTHYAGRLSGGFSISQSLYSRGTTGGASEVGAGAITLSNPDGALDNLLTDYALAGRRVLVYSVQPGAARSTAQLLFMGTCAVPTAAPETISIGLRDRLAELDKDIQTTTYLGNNVPPNGAEGGVELKDKKKPLAFGVVINVPLVCVNSSKLIYQSSDGALAAVRGVYDGGGALSPDTAYSQNLLLNGGFATAEGWSLVGADYEAAGQRINLRPDLAAPHALRQDVQSWATGASYTLGLTLSGDAGASARDVLCSVSLRDTTAPNAVVHVLWAESQLCQVPAGVFTLDIPAITFTSPASGRYLLEISLRYASPAGASLYCDNASLRSPVQEVANLAALEAVAVAPGAYATCKSLGLIRLGGTPSKAVTADVVASGATTIPLILRDIALARGGFQASEVDEPSFTAVYNSREASLGSGIYLPDGGPIREVFDRLAGHYIWWTVTPQGVLRVGKLTPPEGQAYAGRLDLPTVATDVQLITSQDVGEGMPVWKITLKFGHNELVQDDTAVNAGGGWANGTLVASVNPGRRGFVATEWREYVGKSDAIKSQWPLSPELVTELRWCANEMFTFGLGHIAVARDLAMLYTVQRMRLKATVADASSQSYAMGQVLQVTHDRWGLASGRNMVVIGRQDAWDDKGQRTVTYDLWG